MKVDQPPRHGTECIEDVVPSITCISDMDAFLNETAGSRNASHLAVTPLLP